MLSLPGSFPQKPNLRKLGAEKNDKKLLLLVLKKKATQARLFWKELNVANANQMVFFKVWYFCLRLVKERALKYF